MIYTPPYYSGWKPAKLKKEIEKLRSEKDTVSAELHRVSDQLNGIDSTIKGMQFMLVCNSGLRGPLRGWRGEQ